MVSSRVEEILDAAETRIREAGYNGFSFRDIAADVGIKSASVHHHFPTKAAMAAAVARRYTDRFTALLENGDGDIVVLSCRAFRQSLMTDKRMCLCGVLAAEINDLPPEVATEARRFFQQVMNAIAQGLPQNERADLNNHAAAARIVATLEGAMLLAQAFGDISLFDQATVGLGSGV